MFLAAVPPPPSGRHLGFGEVEILDPIVPMVTDYLQCLESDLSKHGGMMTTDRMRYRALARQALRRCADLRAARMAAAEQALSQAPDYQDPARRELAIRHAFEGTDHWIRFRPEIMEHDLNESLARQSHGNSHAQNR
jgi:hypothetical protein